MPKHKTVEQLEAELAAIAAKTRAIELRNDIKKAKEAHSKLVQQERAKNAAKLASKSKKPASKKKSASKKAPKATQDATKT